MSCQTLSTILFRLLVQQNEERYWKQLLGVSGVMDFCIPQHGQKFYSHKFKKSGLCYEVALCIMTGDILWMNGPYEPGFWPDILKLL